MLVTMENRLGLGMWLGNFRFPFREKIRVVKIFIILFFKLITLYVGKSINHTFISINHAFRVTVYMFLFSSSLALIKGFI